MSDKEINNDFDPSDPEKDGTRRQFYDQWYRELLSELTGYVSFKNATTPDGNGLAGCLTTSEARRLDMLICQKIPGMTLEHWASLNIVKRIKVMRSALSLSSIDNDNYVPIGCLWPIYCDSLSVAKTFMSKWPEEKLRRRKPSPQRLEVHAGDWVRCWDEHKKISDEAAEGLGKGVQRRH